MIMRDRKSSLCPSLLWAATLAIGFGTVWARARRLAWHSD